MRSSGQSTVDERVVKALGHPLRQRILHALSEGVASPNQLAKRLDEPLGNVSYHVKILLDNDLIELVETQPVRGAIAHFYRAAGRPFFDDDHWRRLPAAARRTLFGQTLEEIGEHLVDAAAASGFDRIETHVSWTPLQLDEQGWSEIADLLAGIFERVAEIEAASLVRLAEAANGAEPLRSELVALHFERAPKERTGASPRPARRNASDRGR
jgi:DNA-binding transcriptional ArsR family regulator